VYGVRAVGSSEVRSSGGRMNVRIMLSALDVRRDVPSADHCADLKWFTLRSPSSPVYWWCCRLDCPPGSLLSLSRDSLIVQL